MADSDQIFGNLPPPRRRNIAMPGAPYRPEPPPARGAGELAPVDPRTIVGAAAPYLERFNYDMYQGATHPFSTIANAQTLGSEWAGQAAGWGAGKIGLPNPQLLGNDVTAMLQAPSTSPGPLLQRATPVAAAPFTVASNWPIGPLGVGSTLR